MIVLFDGSFEGFLTAVFESYALNIKNPLFRVKSGQNLLFDDFIEVAIDEPKANRVTKKMEQLFTKQSVRQFWKATLIEEETIFQDLFAMIQQGISTNQNILGDFGNVHVVRFHDALKRIGRERHRMTAFVRFELTTDGVYSAVIEPDFNVLPVLVNHFKNRYADQKWFIFDKKRRYGIYYDLQEVFPVEFYAAAENELARTPDIVWSEEEQHFQNLWQTYYNSATIASRKNTRLHLRHIPKRYWKYLSEKRPV